MVVKGNQRLGFQDIVSWVYQEKIALDNHRIHCKTPRDPKMLCPLMSSPLDLLLRPLIRSLQQNRSLSLRGCSSLGITKNQMNNSQLSLRTLYCQPMFPCTAFHVLQMTHFHKCGVRSHLDSNMHQYFYPTKKSFRNDNCISKQQIQTMYTIE